MKTSRTNNTKAQTFTRRGFLKASLFGAGLAIERFALPTIAFGQSQTAAVAVIGCGQWGGSLIQDLLGCNKASIVALCDPDQSRLNAQAQVLRDAGKQGILLYTDYRNILNRRDIDVVVVATPAQWLAKITRDACYAVKDVFVETPASHTVYEGQKV
jgi:predicted dehydrogenase